MRIFHLPTSFDIVDKADVFNFTARAILFQVFFMLFRGIINVALNRCFKIGYFRVIIRIISEITLKVLDKLFTLFFICVVCDIER